MNLQNPYSTTAPPRFQQVVPPTWNYGIQPAEVNQPMSAQQNLINWVQGIEAVKSYPMAPGAKMAFFDADQPRVYIKEIDISGKPLELEIYDLVKVEPVNEEATKIDTSAFMTEEKAAELIPALVKSEIEKAMSEISLKPTSKKKKGDEE